MVSILILIFSVIAMFQLGLSYCRSVLAGFTECGISGRTREMGALGEGALRGEDFCRLLSLIRVCPHPGNDGSQLLFVRLYFMLLGTIGKLGGISQKLVEWTVAERRNCAHAAAVMLDRRVVAEDASSQ